MAGAATPPPTARDYALPAGTDEVVGVFVNGVERRPGVDYERLPDRLRFRAGLRPPPHTGLGGALMTALCAGVYPEGDEVDAIVRRGGALESVPLAPADV